MASPIIAEVHREEQHGRNVSQRGSVYGIDFVTTTLTL